MAEVQKNKILEQYAEDVKRDILFYIILELKRYEITKEDAQNLAQDFLSIFPVLTVEDLLTKLNDLGKTYKEAQKVFLKYATSYYNQQKQEVLEKIPPFLKSGDIDAALSILRTKPLSN